MTGKNYFKMSLGSEPFDLGEYRSILNVNGSEMKLVEDALNRIKAACFNQASNRWVTLYFGVALDDFLKNLDKYLPRLFSNNRAIARDYFSLKTAPNGKAHKSGFLKLQLKGKQNGREVLFFGIDRRYAALWQMSLPEANRFFHNTGVESKKYLLGAYANFVAEILVRCLEDIPWTKSNTFIGSRGLSISNDQKEILVPRKLLGPSTLMKLRVTQFIIEYLIRLEIDPFRGFLPLAADVEEKNGELQARAPHTLRRVSGGLNTKYSETSLPPLGDSMPRGKKNKNLKIQKKES